MAQGPFWFVLDTGAAGLCLMQAAQRCLHQSLRCGDIEGTRRKLSAAGMAMDLFQLKVWIFKLEKSPYCRYQISIITLARVEAYLVIISSPFRR